MTREAAIYLCVLCGALACSLERSPLRGGNAPLPDIAEAETEGADEKGGDAFGNPTGSVPAITPTAAETEPAQSTDAGAQEAPASPADDPAAVPEPQQPQAGAGAGAGGGAAGAGAGAAGVGAEPDPPLGVAAPPAGDWVRFAKCASDEDCADDETCILMEAIAFCAQTCGAADACEPLEGGPQPICGGLFPDGEGFCRMPCDSVVNEGCPHGMICQDPVPAFPVGTGSCGHEVN